MVAQALGTTLVTRMTLAHVPNRLPRDEPEKIA
jgi:hypothetical protein